MDLNINDRVLYAGRKYHGLYSKEGHPARGVIIARVTNQPSALVVDFEGETYILPRWAVRKAREEITT